jgi:hypothetical protein
MEGTGDDSVEIHAWSSVKVATFVRSLGTAQCFQFAGDQVLQLGVDGSVFFALSLNDFQGVCGHARTQMWFSFYPKMTGPCWKRK